MKTDRQTDRHAYRNTSLPYHFSDAILNYSNVIFKLYFLFSEKIHRRLTIIGMKMSLDMSHE